MPGESFTINCSCEINPGTTPPATTAYVRSVNDLVGMITLAGTGATAISSSGNTITIGLTGEAGLGSVTSVALASSSDNLVVVSGSPVTTNGTITIDLALALDSIAGLTTAADQMIYTTASNTYATTSLTSFARTLLDDAAAVNVRSTLGLVIGTNVQAWSADLDSVVSNTSWSGAHVTFAGDITLSTGTLNLTNGDINGISINLTDNLVVGDAATITNTITAGNFSGDGSLLTALNASSFSSGTLAVARGGTGVVTYAVGDLLYASGATTLSKLADVAAGSFLRSGGVNTAPAWSTTLWPNTLTTGDVLYASSATQVSRLAGVATGNVIISGGVGTAPNWGKVTSSHVDSTIPTIAGGVNGDISSFAVPVTFVDSATFSSQISLTGALFDSAVSEGTSGQILTSTVTGTLWSSQIELDTLTINTSLSMEGTVTAGGVTGNQTINKPCGTVNFAAGASSLTVTNSLATANTIVVCTVLTNDTTALFKNVVSSSGQFVIRLNAATTAETKVGFVLIEPS